MDKKEWKEYEVDPIHQREGMIWVEVVAHIRKNDTGEIRLYRTHEPLYKGEKAPNIFNWAENNYSCDCNRRLFFGRVIEGEDWWDCDDEDDECSDGQYSVNLQNPVTGEFYYKEY